MLKHCAANRKRRLSALPNVSPYIYDVKISGFTRSSIYIYDISRLRFKLLGILQDFMEGRIFDFPRITSRQKKTNRLGKSRIAFELTFTV
jgi:hypothetical protein